MTNTYNLVFRSYGKGAVNNIHQVYIEARSMEAAIQKVEKSNPEWFFTTCQDWWQGAKNSWGIK